MLASKENARRALECLQWLVAGNESCEDQYRIVLIQGFLEAAERKLPSEAAFAKDRRRRKAVK